MKAEIRTFTGKVIDIFDPKPEDIDITDIIHSLSLQCRFNGHSRTFYSVAQHSVNMSGLARQLNYTDIEAKQALFHDAAEAYISDIISPIKDLMPGIQDAENRILAVIFERIGIPGPAGPRVAFLDRVMLEIEGSKMVEGWVPESEITEVDLSEVSGMVDLRNWGFPETQKRFRDQNRLFDVLEEQKNGGTKNGRRTRKRKKKSTTSKRVLL